MHKQVPTKIRSVIRTAITSFREGHVAKADVEKLLKKSFSNKTFQQVLLCVQGDLAKCDKIDLEKWRCGNATGYKGVTIVRGGRWPSEARRLARKH